MLSRTKLPQRSGPHGPLLLAGNLLAWCTLCAAGGWPSAARAADPAPAAKEAAAATKNAPAANAGRVIPIRLPLTGAEATRVRRVIGRVLKDLPQGEPRPILVFEFSPGQSQFGEGSDFGAAYNLADYLSGSELNGVRTVAFVPRTIKGHAVLVALACEEIIMAPDAELGEAGIDEKTIRDTVRAGYKEIVGRRHKFFVPVVLAMLDKDLVVERVETEMGTEFVFEPELAEVRKRASVVSTEELSPRPGLYSGTRLGRNGLGLVSHLAVDRAAVAKALNLSADSVRPDPSLEEEWQPIKISINGPIDAKVYSRVSGILEQQIRDQHVNFVCLLIDSAGGPAQGALDLANYLANLPPEKIRTTAYIGNKARSSAALVALACDEIALEQDAVLGGSGDLQLTADQLGDTVQTYRRSVAARKGRSWSLGAAMINPALRVYKYTRTDGRVDYFCEEELAEQPDRDAWRQGQEITKVGVPLLLNAREAADLHVAEQVDNFDAFKQLNDLTEDPREVEPGWAHFLIEKLAHPEFAVLLLVIGGAAMLAELQAPGIGIGAFVALVCFTLYFWSQFLHGTADWLEIMLFLVGLCCLMLEIFVIPGFGIFGLGGGLLVITSLVLASQTFVIPRNDYQMEQLRNSLVVMAVSGAGIVAAVLVLRRYLPRAPLVHRMMLEPPSGQELERISMRESLVDFRHLLGQEGVATTRLTPSGKARFGEDLVNVITTGEFIERGEAIVVVEVRGNRVLVQQLEDEVDV